MSANPSLDAGAALSSPAQLPAVDKLLASAALQPVLGAHGLSGVTAAVRRQLEALRSRLRAGEVLAAEMATPEALARVVEADLQRQRAPPAGGLQPHRHGAAHQPGPRPAARRGGAGRGAGPDQPGQPGIRPGHRRRGDRDDLVNDLLCELTGAEAATVVNNNAAAVLLMLNALAARKEVIVSRGELVEIGGAFRIPDIMARAGARLVEVGTTNRTHARDYEGAITPKTGLLMKVHCSNYAVTGFTASVAESEVARIAHAQGLPLAVDLGSGTLIDLADWGLPHEPTVRDVVTAGADVVTFSGDKLLGGPQAGLIVGRKDLIAKIKKNPLKRALRVGKLTLAALEPVLRLYQAPEFLAERLPALRLFTRPQAAMQAQAQRLLAPLQAALGSAYQVSLAPMFSQIGSGALPVNTLPSAGLRIEPAEARRAGRALSRLEAAWRAWRGR
jgi:L-seryl-tRNA(Ser) seleniumtransferase